MTKKGYTEESSGQICRLVEAACCITANGKGYDIDNDFNSWVREYVKMKLGMPNKFKNPWS